MSATISRTVTAPGKFSLGQRVKRKEKRKKKKVKNKKKSLLNGVQ